VLKRLVSSGATQIAQVDPILTGQVVRDYDECRIAYTEMLEKLSHRTQAAIQRRARILGVDLRKTRIAWRFVDSFEDTVRWRGTGSQIHNGILDTQLARQLVLFLDQQGNCFLNTPQSPTAVHHLCQSDAQPRDGGRDG
jgi:hypothetical protein